MTDLRQPRGRPPQELYYQIVESAEDMAIISMDLSGSVTSWNPGAERLLGYRERDIIGASADIIFTREDCTRGVHVKERATALAEGKAEDERWHARQDGSRFWGSGLMMPLKGPDGDPIGFLKMFRDRTEHHRNQESRKLLLRELNHRVKNIIAMIQALAYSLLRANRSIAGFELAFTDRLRALSRAHDLLTAEEWRGVTLHDVVNRTLEAYADLPAHVDIGGPTVILRSDSTVALHLVFYELTTNAAKYGALSHGAGKIEVRWQIVEDEMQPMLSIDWRERGGPSVLPPERRGFGSRLIAQSATQLGGKIDLDYDPSGLRCALRLPLAANIVEGEAPA